MNYFNNIKDSLDKIEKNRKACKLNNIDYEKEYYLKDNLRLKQENTILNKRIYELEKEVNLLKFKLTNKESKRKYIKKNVEQREKEKEYKEFRKKILFRDNYCCRECGSKYRLQVHHIKSRKDYPELLMDENNCITLCIVCHSKTNNFFIT